MWANTAARRNITGAGRVEGGGVKTLLSFGVKRVREIQKGSLTLLTFVDYVVNATVSAY